MITIMDGAFRSKVRDIRKRIGSHTKGALSDKIVMLFIPYYKHDTVMFSVTFSHRLRQALSLCVDRICEELIYFWIQTMHSSFPIYV